MFCLWLYLVQMIKEVLVCVESLLPFSLFKYRFFHLIEEKEERWKANIFLPNWHLLYSTLLFFHSMVNISWSLMSSVLHKSKVLRVCWFKEVMREFFGRLWSSLPWRPCSIQPSSTLTSFISCIHKFMLLVFTIWQTILPGNNKNSTSINFWGSTCPLKNSLFSVLETQCSEISLQFSSPLGRDAQERSVNILLKQNSSWQMTFLLVLENTHPHTHTYACLMGGKNIFLPKAWTLHASWSD